MNVSIKSVEKTHAALQDDGVRTRLDTVRLYITFSVAQVWTAAVSTAVGYTWSAFPRNPNDCVSEWMSALSKLSSTMVLPKGL